ncbi:MAG: hypothetical protein ACTHLX_06085, partial [Candidatus Binatia bacterium]
MTSTTKIFIVASPYCPLLQEKTAVVANSVDAHEHAVVMALGIFVISANLIIEVSFLLASVRLV